MATLEFSEYAAPTQAYGQVLALDASPYATQQVAIGASSASAAAFNAGTKLIRVNSDTDCRIAIGGAASKTAPLSPLVKANVEYLFGVRGGQVLSVIAAS